MEVDKILIKPNFLVLDGLRGIASIYVVFNHCRGNLYIGGNAYSEILPISEWTILTKVYYTLLQFTSLGYEFVIIFFVLSGFSIAYALSKKHQILSFYKRRLLRLYPPFILALIWAGFVFYLVRFFAPNQLLPDARSVYDSFTYILLNLFYIPKGDLIPQFWSLTYEVIFYILIALFYQKKLSYYIYISIIGYVIGQVLHFIGVTVNDILSRFFLDYNLYFAVGILLFKNFNRIEPILVMRKYYFILTTILTIILMTGVKIVLGPNNTVSLLISGMLAVLMIVNFLHYNISNKVLEFFGKMSYTIYITHFASMYLFAIFLDKLGFPYHTNITTWYIWLLGVLFCLLLAVPLYYLVEYPTKRILGRNHK